MGVSAKTAIKQGLTMGGVRRRRGSIGIGKRSWDCTVVWRGVGPLTNIHSKVTASVGDCLDQGSIFRR